MVTGMTWSSKGVALPSGRDVSLYHVQLMFELLCIPISCLYTAHACPVSSLGRILLGTRDIPNSRSPLHKKLCNTAALDVWVVQGAG